MAKDKRGVERTKDGNGRFCRSLEQVDEDREAARLYARLSSYTKVAEAQGCNVATAFRRVQRAFAGEPDDSTEVARKVSLARLAAMATLVQDVAEETHLAHSNGRIVGLLDGESGVFTPLLDRSVNLAAVDRLLRIEDQRARLLGSYAATRARVEVVPSDVVERLIAENEAMIRVAEIELGLPSSLPETDRS
jgi:hypothetical protein